MSAVELTVTHDGTTYPGTIMRIRKAHFGLEDHGILTALLDCNAGSTGVGVGGFGLDRPRHDSEGKFLGREGSAFGLDHLIRIMETVGVRDWSELVGKDVIVLWSPGGRGGAGSMSVGIASLDGSRVLVLKEHADRWAAEHPEAVTV